MIYISQWCRSTLCGHPLPTLTDNWTHGAASRHTIAPISHTRPSPHSPQQVSYYSFSVPLRVGGWVGLSTQYFSYLLKVACSGPGVSWTRNLSVTSPTECEGCFFARRTEYGRVYRCMEGYIVCCGCFVSEDRILGDSITRCEILHSGIYICTGRVFRLLGQYPNFPKGPKIQNFGHLTADISEMITHSIRCQL